MPVTLIDRHIYIEFAEFTRAEIREYEKQFIKYDLDNSNFIDQHELQLMMEQLGEPQTHIGLKNMIEEIDEDGDGQINFKEFLTIFRKASLGELVFGSALSAMAQLLSIDVSEVGVKGAAEFFEAKAKALFADNHKYQDAMRAEKEEQEREVEEREKARLRKEAFKKRAMTFDV